MESTDEEGMFRAASSQFKPTLALLEPTPLTLLLAVLLAVLLTPLPASLEPILDTRKSTNLKHRVSTEIHRCH